MGLVSFPDQTEAGNETESCYCDFISSSVVIITTIIMYLCTLIMQHDLCYRISLAPRPQVMGMIIGPVPNQSVITALCCDVEYILSHIYI